MLNSLDSCKASRNYKSVIMQCSDSFVRTISTILIPTAENFDFRDDKIYKADERYSTPLHSSVSVFICIQCTV
jgi:hypothetical protein